MSDQTPVLNAATKPRRPVESQQQPGTEVGAVDRNAPAMPPQAAGEVSEDVAKDYPKGFVRQPFGSRAARLSAAKRPGYHRHWFNDSPGRVEDAQKAGYKHVKENGKPITRTAGVSAEGGALKAYLMEIPEEWFKEDMARGQAEVDEIDAAIRGGRVASKDDDSRYIPDNGRAIRIED